MPRSLLTASPLGMAALLAAVLLGGPAGAVIYTVNTTADTNDGSCSVEHCSIREALTAANAGAGLDKIAIPAGTYELSRAGVGEDFADKGDLDIRGPLVISGAGAESTLIDADYIDRVLDIHDIGSPYSVIIEEMTLERGNTYQEPGANGGGIRSRGTAANPIDLTVRDAVVRENRGAYAGGGIFFTWGTLTVLRSAFEKNAAEALDNWSPQDVYGGGLYVRHGSLVLEDSLIWWNWAWIENIGDALGGGLHFDSSSSTCTTCTLSISDTTFQRNSAFSGDDRGFGGGIFFRQGVGGPDVTVERNTFFDNGASTGGALYLLLEGGQALIENTTITQNYGSIRAGGAYLNVRSSEADTPAIVMRHVTLVENVSPNAKALAASESVVGLGNSELRFVNTLIEGDCQLENIALMTLGGNMESPGDTCGLTNASDYPSTPAPLLLGPLTGNGGLTETRALLLGSPAIDRAFGFACVPTDQRVSLRPTTKCDIGAYEAELYPFPIFTIVWTPIPNIYMFTGQRPPRATTTATRILAPLGGDVAIPLRSSEPRTISILKAPNLGTAQVLGPEGWHEDPGLMAGSLETQGFLYYRPDTTEPGFDEVTIRGTDEGGEHEDLRVTIEVPEPGVGVGLVAGIVGLTALASRRRR